MSPVLSIISIVIINKVIISIVVVSNVGNKLVFVFDKPFQSSLMFASKTRAYLSESFFSCTTLG